MAGGLNGLAGSSILLSFTVRGVEVFWWFVRST